MKSIILFLLGIFCLSPVSSQDFIKGPNTGWDCGEFAIADFDNDGYSDIFGIDYFYQKPDDIYLYANKKTPVLEFTRTLVLKDIEINGIVSSDYDKDGDIDVLYSEKSTADLGVFLNDGLGQFTTKALNVSGSTSMKVFDLENDGDLDIIGTDKENKNLDIYTNNGSQIFTKKSILTNVKNLSSFDLADIDGDKYLDLVVGFYEFTGDQIVLLKNNGNNAFDKTVIHSNTFFQLEKVVFLDINLDNKLDILGLSSSSLSAWLNDGLQSFTEKNLISNSFDSARDMDIADLNGDKVADIVVTNNFGGVMWFENTSKEALTYAKKDVGEVSPGFQVLINDLDKDDDNDLVVVNGDLWWFTNNITQIPSTVTNFSSDSFFIFPNPINQDIVKLVGLDIGVYNIEIVDLNGHSILKTRSTEMLLDCAKLSTGVFILRVFDVHNNVLVNERIVKI